MNEDKLSIMEWLSKFPIPLILLLIGMGFVLLSLGVGYKSIRITEPKNQKKSLIFGVIFVVINLLWLVSCFLFQDRFTCPSLIPISTKIVTDIPETPLTPDTPTAKETETIPPPTATIKEPCFDTDTWTPYEKDSTVKKEKKCWNFSAWGFKPIPSNGISIIPAANYSEGQAYGIYANIFEDVEIKFKINIEEFETHGIYSAYVRYGVIEEKGPETSFLIYHHYLPQESKSRTTLKEGSGTPGNTLDIYPDLGTVYEVVITVENSLLTVDFDEMRIIENMRLEFEDRYFYISYHIPDDSRLEAYIYDLEIHEK